IGSASITVTAGAAASITLTSGSGQSATVNTGFTNPLVATVRDQFNNLVPGASVTFAGPASGAGITNEATITTDSSGQASDSVTANTIAGAYTVAVTAAGVLTPANFTLTNTAGAAASISVTSGSAQSTTVNTSFTNPLVATVRD